MTWYIVDGMDGSGKSTVAGMLASELRSKGRRVLLIEHPNRDILLGRVEAKLLLFDGKPAMVASTALYVMDVVRSVTVMKFHGREYDDIIFVRYIMAVSYLPDGLAAMAYKVFAGILPTPDVRVFVDVDEHTAMGRIESRGDDRERFETEEKLGEIRRRMLGFTDGWIVIDNSDMGRSESAVRRIADSQSGHRFRIHGI